MEITFALVALIVIAIIAWLLVKKGQKPTESAVPGLPSTSRVVYTDHALQRMRQRDVSKAQITEVLERPERALEDKAQGSIRLERNFDGRTLKVWVNPPWPATPEAVVRTTAWNASTTFEIPSAAIGRVKGKGGATVRRIELETSTWISVGSDGRVLIKADRLEAIKLAQEKIQSIVSPQLPRLGELMACQVTELLPHGVAVVTRDGVRGTVHISRLRPLAGGRRIDNVSDVAVVGQTLQVRVEEISNGRIRFALT